MKRKGELKRFHFYSGSFAEHLFFINRKGKLFSCGRNNGKLDSKFDENSKDGQCALGHRITKKTPREVEFFRTKMKIDLRKKPPVNIGLNVRTSVFLIGGRVFICGRTPIDIQTDENISLIPRSMFLKLRITGVYTSQKNVLFVAGPNLFGYGENIAGSLGVRPPSRSHTNIQFVKKFPSNIVHVSGGHAHVVCVTESGVVWGVGRRGRGRLGLPNEKHESHTFEQLHIPSHVKIVHSSCGFANSLFLTSKGNVWGCGGNSCGRVGVDTQEVHVLRPKQLGTLNKYQIQSIRTGTSSSSFVSGCGKVLACGEGRSSGQGEKNMIPAVVLSDPAVVQIEALTTCLMAITRDSVYFLNSGVTDFEGERMGKWNREVLCWKDISLLGRRDGDEWKTRDYAERLSFLRDRCSIFALTGINL